MGQKMRIATIILFCLLSVSNRSLANEPRAFVEVALQGSSNSYVPNDVWIQSLPETTTNILNYEFLRANQYGEWLADYIRYARFNDSRQHIRDANEYLAKLNGWGYELLLGKVVITDLSPATIIPIIKSHKAKNDDELYWYHIKLFSKVPLKFTNVQCAYISYLRGCYGQFGNLPGVKETTVVTVSFDNFWENNVTKGIKKYSGDVFLFSGEMENPFLPVIGRETVNIPVSNLDEVKLIMEEKIFYPGIHTSEPGTATFFEDDGRTFSGGNSMMRNNFFFIK